MKTAYHIIFSLLAVMLLCNNCQGAASQPAPGFLDIESSELEDDKFSRLIDEQQHEFEVNSLKLNKELAQILDHLSAGKSKQACLEMATKTCAALKDLVTNLINKTIVTFKAYGIDTSLDASPEISELSLMRNKEIQSIDQILVVLTRIINSFDSTLEGLASAKTAMGKLFVIVEK